MSWYKKTEIEYRNMPSTEDFDDEDSDIDVYQAMDEAEKVFQNSGIRPDSRKEMTNIALSDGTVIGAIASNWSEATDYDFPVMEFSFDVAVDKKFRGSEQVGMKLIQEAINTYEEEKTMYEESDYKTRIKLWVINTGLIPILEKFFGFEIESDLGHGQAHMVRY